MLMRGAGAYWSEGSGVACLLVHGLTASPQELRPLANVLSSHGYGVVAPRLPGHGETAAELATAGADDWRKAVDRALDQARAMADSVVAIGISMGGSLVYDLAGRRSDDLSGAVVINAPSVAMPQLAALAQDPDVPDVFPSPFDQPRLHTKDPTRSLIYNLEIAKHALGEAVDLIAGVHQVLAGIRCPVLILHSEADLVVSADHPRAALAAISSSDKTLTWLTDSVHVPTHDYDFPLLAADTLRFISRVSPST
jgi:carboxylesterase